MGTWRYYFHWGGEVFWGVERWIIMPTREPLSKRGWRRISYPVRRHRRHHHRTCPRKSHRWPGMEEEKSKILVMSSVFLRLSVKLCHQNFWNRTYNAWTCLFRAPQTCLSKLGKILEDNWFRIPNLHKINLLLIIVHSNSQLCHIQYAILKSSQLLSIESSLRNH